MSLPGNGIFVVRGEMSILITAMRRGSRWNSTAYMEDEKDGIMKLFINLKHILNRVEDLRLIDPNVFLAPFLEVIRTDETTGAVTSLALASINKFLSFGLLDPTSPNLAQTVENIVDAVTHARFMGTDQSSDGVTLFRVVEVLHTLMRSPEGSALTNEAVCEVMLSCFKICFEPRLNELLRRSAEQALKDMVLLLFMRLPQFSEDRSESGLIKKFQMMAASMEQNKKQRKKQSKIQLAASTHRNNSQRSTDTDKKVQTSQNSTTTTEQHPQTPHMLDVVQSKVPPLATTPATPAGNILDMQGKITQTPTSTLDNTENDVVDVTLSTQSVSTEENLNIKLPAINTDLSNVQNTATESLSAPTNLEDQSSEYVNSVGVRFTQQNSLDGSDGMGPLVPYGLPCIQELFRFLIMLCNPFDKQNTDTMMHMGLSLLTVAFEVGADNIGKYDTLLELVKDDLCRHLISLLKSERLTIFAADLQLCFLLFESLRGHLKFQMEAYLKKLSEIIASDNPKTLYEMRELALDNLLQLWRIPGFVSELYINYDCDLYCTDMFESLTNMLSKYTLSATNAVYSTHIIAMDTLISVIESIERNCIAAKNLNSESNSVVPVQPSNRHSRQNSGLDGIIIDGRNDVIIEENKVDVENISKFINNSTRLRLSSASTTEACVTREHLEYVKIKKRVLTQGTELFNQRPDKGIQFLQENNILNSQLDSREIALFLRENSGLDKKMIGEYISKKKNVDSKILMNFVDSFDFVGLRIDQALRLYLETFRLPGEAPLIFLVLEHFADHWHTQNGEPLINTDAAFRLAYAIIMLNMDQHNSNAKRLNVPMEEKDFIKNLRGLNGGSDFDQEMLSAIYNAIKSEEIVMPAEQTGIVRENYLWKVLLRRGAGVDGAFNYVENSAYDLELFNIVWGPSLSALSFMFDKSNENGYQHTLSGFTKCACISAHYNLHEDFDALILTLCKFTTLLNTVQLDATTPVHNDIVQAVNFGLNPKAQSAIKAVFAMVHDYGDSLREGWKNILDLFLQLFRLKLLPKSIMEVEDFCEENGKVQLILEKPSQKQEAGLFSSLYSYLSSEGAREPSAEEQEFIKIGKKCIKECQLEQMVQESKFVQVESLQELIKNVLSLIKAPNAHKSVGLPYSEDIVVFWMEFLVKIVIHNRDRMITMWSSVRDQMYLLLMGGASCGYDYLLNRSIVAVLKLAIYLMRNEELCPIVLQSLKMLLMLKPAVVLRISKQISIGIYELLKTSAQNIHSEQDWQIIFTILECVGAGAVPPEFEDASLPTPNSMVAKSDGALSSEEDSGINERGYISDSEVSAKNQQHQQQKQQQVFTNSSTSFPSSPTAENWILVNKDTDLNSSRPQSPPVAVAQPPTLSTLIYNCKLIEHSPFALFKCWDSLAFIVRNVAHITPYNFESCVRCIRTFVEACRDGGLRQRRQFEATIGSKINNKKKSVNRRTERDVQRNDGYGADLHNDAEEDDLVQRYETLSIQLLDLMYTLYTRTAQIFRWWAEEGGAVPQCSALWAQGWCPLLQGIARLAMDRRREVRTYAISCLQQRALLVHDLQTLSGAEWASCFQKVLFPLLNELLPESASVAHLDVMLLEESRIRTATIMSKVFLHHLTPLIELGEAFNELWIEILDYIEKFMRVGSDMLSEQMQEILKNMLLVMHSVRVFHNDDGTLLMPLWQLTWGRIGEFLPNLKNELFRDEGNHDQLASSTTHLLTNTTNVDVVNVPPVVILPKQKEQSEQVLQQQEKLIVSPSPLITPAESPRHNVVLQPPIVDATNQNMPILIPYQQQQQFQTPGVLYNISNNLLLQAAPPTLIQPIPRPVVVETKNLSSTETVMPDVVNEATKVANEKLISTSDNTNQMSFETTCVQEAPKQPSVVAPIVNATIINNTTTNYNNNYSFAIDLPEAPPNTNIYGDVAHHEQHNGQTTPQVIHEQQHHISEKQQLEIQYQQYRQQYQQHLMQHQEQQLQPNSELKTNINAANTDSQTAVPAAVIDSSPHTNSAITDNVNVPISHFLVGNQYPSLPKIPNSAIVHSFTPVYVQSQAAQSGADIYQEYMQNPYNLTLQQQQQQQQHETKQFVTTEQQSQQQYQPTHLSHEQHQQQTLFETPANYFATSVDPSTIPPGSEMLYGQP